MSCGVDIRDIKLLDSLQIEVTKFNNNCDNFGIPQKLVNNEINHDLNHELWRYDPAYDKINLLDYFLNLCDNTAQIERVKYELELYEKYNMTKLLRCMIWLVDYFTEHNIFWGVGRGSSVSSYCLYLIGLHLVDSLKYDLDVNDFLKW